MKWLLQLFVLFEASPHNDKCCSLMLWSDGWFCRHDICTTFEDLTAPGHVVGGRGVQSAERWWKHIIGSQWECNPPVQSQSEGQTDVSVEPVLLSVMQLDTIAAVPPEPSHLFIRDDSSGLVVLCYSRYYYGDSVGHSIYTRVLRMNPACRLETREATSIVFALKYFFRVFFFVFGLWAASFSSPLLSWDSMFFSVRQPCQVGRVVWVILTAHTTAELTFTTSQAVGLFWSRFFFCCSSHSSQIFSMTACRDTPCLFLLVRHFLFGPLSVCVLWSCWTKNMWTIRMAVLDRHWYHISVQYQPKNKDQIIYCTSSKISDIAPIKSRQKRR